ncbi:MAG: class I SAM-dependent methyltransferase [Actinomycetota bacterium]|nr:class I SAM-dependent methyltransferase [Actinomycetota bacterium]
MCRNGHATALREGYLDISSSAPDSVTERTFESFGYEWNVFDRVQPEDAEFWKEYFADVPMKELEGKVGLDAGCGKGRFALLTAPHLAALVAMDGSKAVQAASRNLAPLSNVLVMKADLREAPFAPESFDFISCLGVLHHLSDPYQGFRALLDLLAPGGMLLLYLYSRPLTGKARQLGIRAAELLRKVTVHLPLNVLRMISIPVAAALYAAYVIPGKLGERMGVECLESLPLANYRGKPLRSLWLDTFDRLSAPVEHRYGWQDLEGWFRSASVEVVAAREAGGWFVLLKKSGN